jgi:uncharacterized membrane-anchored protein YitT (DUF2179 family)
MSQILHNFLKKEAQKQAARKGNGLAPERAVSNYRIAKFWYQWRITAVRIVKDWILIGVGVFSAAFGLKGFLLPNDFIDGGAVGIALLSVVLTDWPLWLLLIVVNTPFILLGMKTMGRKFALKTALAIGLLALVAALVSFPLVTQEKLLVSVFGGFFLGAGIGLAVRGGAVIDGTEILALALSKRVGLTMGDVIFGLNILIFSAAAYLLTVETAMYSLLAYMAAARTVDFVVEGVEEYIGVTIISPKYQDIKLQVVQQMGRGVTVFAGKKGIGKSGAKDDPQILFTVITRLEIGRLNAEIDKIDPNAFVVMHSIKDMRGGMIKRRPLH